jgi:hypothetical protein
VQVEVRRPSYVDRGDVDALLYDMNAYAEENARIPLDVDLAFTAGEGI